MIKKKKTIILCILLIVFLIMVFFIVKIKAKSIEIKQEANKNLQGATSLSDISIRYAAHLSNIGWSDYYADGAWAGRTSSSESSKAYRLEACRFILNNNTGISGELKYRSHVTADWWEGDTFRKNPEYPYGGWCGYTDGKTAISNWITVNNGISGSIGACKHMEAIQLELTGDLTNYFYIDYAVHTYYRNFLSDVDISAIQNSSVGIANKYDLMKKLPGWDVNSYGNVVKDSNFAGTYMCTLPLTGVKAQIKGRKVNLSIHPNGRNLS